MVKFKNSIEQSLWQSVYLGQLQRVDRTKDERIIKSYSIMAAQFADDAIYEFRARAGEHSHLVDVVVGTSDSAFYDKHGESLTNGY